MNFRRALVIALALWLAQGLGTVLITDGHSRALYSSFSLAVSSLVASGILLWVVIQLRKTHPYFAPAWAYFGLAALCFATAGIIRAGQQVQSPEVPFSPVADYFYLGMYLFYAAGVILLPKPRFSRAELLTYALDLSGVTLAICLAWWELLFLPALQNSTFALSGKGIAISAVALDVVLAGALFLLLLRRNPYFIRQPLSLLMFSMAMMVSADIVHGTPTAAATYRAGLSTGLGWSASMLSMLLAGCAQQQALGGLSNREGIKVLQQSPTTPLPRWTDNAPYLLLILGVVVASLRHQTTDTFLGLPLLLSVGVIVLLVIVRQSYSLHENKRLTTHLTSALRERQQVELWQQRYRTLLEYLAGAPPLEPALTRIVQTIEQEVPGAICTVLLVQDARLRPGAGPGMPDFINRALDGLPIGPHIGSCGATAYTGESVIAEDIFTHPNWGPYRELYRPTGIRACWSQPIRSSTNAIIGTFAVYRRVPAVPDAAEMTLVKSYADLASLAIERAAKHSDELLATKVFAESGEMILILDAQQYILRANRKFIEVTGFGDGDILGQPLSILIPEQRDPVTVKTLQTALAGNGRWHGELWCKHKAGSFFPTWLNISATNDSGSGTTHYIAVMTDITTIKASESRIEFLALHDALTGLPNRTLLQTRFEQAQAQADRDQNHVALLFLDLDNFKNINDTLGHTMGDKLLQKAGETLKSSLRQADTVCRQGGDEFLILLPGLTESNIAGRVARKLRENLSQTYDINGHSLVTSCSIGISLYPDDGRDYNTLLKNADTAMYHAKDSGRNMHHFYTEAMNVAATQKMHMENQLRAALQRNEFALHYQPIIEMSSGRLSSLEALLRWRSPEYGDVSPSTFIPVAEDRALIHGISEWVLLHACEQIKAWRDAGAPIPAVSVNLSAHDFRRKDLVPLTVGILDRTGLRPAGCLELEITETVVMADVEASTHALRELTQLGIGISIDDFGTGYSSLSYLKQFPLNKLKIDRSFIKDLATDASDRGIVSAIVNLGNNLRLATVAEGVETASQHEFLVNAGCAQAQGYFFTPPLPPEELLVWLRGRGYWSEGAVRAATV
jgi:diguanylate cyclase (GGDEF)-like protein/PAS domain S-box-containing protein